MPVDRLTTAIDKGHFENGLRVQPKPTKVRKRVVVAESMAFAGFVIGLLVTALSYENDSKGKSYHELEAEAAAFIKAQKERPPSLQWVPKS